MTQEFTPPHPQQRIVAGRPESAAGVSHTPRVQDHGAVSVVMRGADDVFPDTHRDAEFFVQFPRETDLLRFTWFDLATGKFPEAGHVAPRRAPREQDTSTTFDQCGGDVKRF